MKYLIFLGCFTTVMYWNSAFYVKHRLGRRTYGHEDITEVGTLRALTSYIFQEKLNKNGSLIAALETFYLQDEYSKTEMEKSIYDVIQAIINIQAEQQHNAYVHVNAEQIMLAHNHVISCREKLLMYKEDIQELRRQLGECLYTIQSFYSNTNWVEMYGGVPYLDFGVKGRRLMSIAGYDEDTCIDMPNETYNCQNNLLVKDKLTSGYYHGRGNLKPFRASTAKSGKCSHGGRKDESRKIVARCGINKESSSEVLSPHYNLHFQAYFAAVEATDHFLIGEGTGVLDLLGTKVFDEIFHIKIRKKTSLAFAIDYSGSMSEDMAAVIETAIQLVTSTKGSANEPTDYVLSLFNDPANLSMAFVFQNGFEMIEKMKNVKISGGGDCPELAAAGILKAIELSRPGSTLFVFTDADAKDEDRRPEVEQAAIRKRIPITTMLTGRCSRKRRKRSFPRKVRDATDFFQQLAQTTGGTVHNTDKSSISTVIKEVIKNVFPTAEVVLDWFTWTTTALDMSEFTVDNTISVLKIAIIGLSSKDGVALFNPDGVLEERNTIIYTDKKETIISLQQPVVGLYKLKRNEAVKMSINITAQSTITITHSILDKTESGSYITLTGDPIAGKDYTYIINLFNLVENWTCSDISLTNTNGKTIVTGNANQTSTTIGTQCEVVLRTPLEAYQVKINGSDNNGSEFSRKLSTAFNPSNVELHVFSNTEAAVNKDTLVRYELKNNGNSNETYEVTITDDYAFALMPKIHKVDVGDNMTGSFILRPTRAPLILTFQITVSLLSTSEILQHYSKKIAVTKVQKPECEIISIDKICNMSRINHHICDNFIWTSESEITFEGTELDNITTDSGPDVIVTHTNITSLSKGPVFVNISGTCCTPVLTLSILDVSGNIAQCFLNVSSSSITAESFYSDLEIERVEKPIMNKEKERDSHETLVVCVAISVGFVVIVLGVCSIIIYKKMHSSNYYIRSSPQNEKQNNREPRISVTYHAVKTNVK